MALVKCVECGHHYSTLAEKCPSCGIPAVAERRAARVLLEQYAVVRATFNRVNNFRWFCLITSIGAILCMGLVVQSSYVAELGLLMMLVSAVSFVLFVVGSFKQRPYRRAKLALECKLRDHHHA